MNPLAIVAEYFPDAEEALLEYILWEYTGWPAFFPAGDREQHLRTQLDEYRSAYDRALVARGLA